MMFIGIPADMSSSCVTVPVQRAATQPRKSAIESPEIASCRCWPVLSRRIEPVLGPQPCQRSALKSPQTPLQSHRANQAPAPQQDQIDAQRGCEGNIGHAADNLSARVRTVSLHCRRADGKVRGCLGNARVVQLAPCGDVAGRDS